jgi:RNA polymerase sigma factor (sigma-70 family)
MPSPGGDDMIAHWLGQAGQIPLLTAAEAIHLGGLVRRWQDWEPSPDEAPAAVRRRGLHARDRMVSANLRLVVSVATKCFRHDAPLIDRLQSGSIGLARAVEKFDPARGYTFSTYAFWWIRQAIDRGELDEKTIRLPGPAHAAVRGRRNGACPPHLLEAALSVASLLSLDSPVPGDDRDLGETLAAPAPDADLHADELRERMARLDPIERQLITGRWLQSPPLSCDQLAALATVPPLAPVSIAKARSILNRAVRKLREGVPPAPAPPPPPPPPVVTLPPSQPGGCCQLSLELSILNT